MDLQVLAQELANDPLAVGYADMPDPDVADAINAPSRPAKVPVPAPDVRRYVLLKGLWPRIASLAQSSPNPLWQGTAITILQTLAPNSFDAIRMNDPDVASAVTQMLTTMVEAGALQQIHVDEMTALGDSLVSRGAELGLGHVNFMDVGMARLSLSDPGG